MGGCGKESKMEKLEDIAKTYGMNDYMDSISGKIYELSKAIDDGNGRLLVPVISTFGDHTLEAYAIMQKEGI